MRQFIVWSDGLDEATATAVRVLTVAVAALALVIGGQPVDPRLAYLGLAYLVLSGLLWWLAPRFTWHWLVYLAALIDVGAVTAFLAFAPPTTLPLWVLYLLPIISAGMAGPAPAAWAAGLSIAGYVGLILVSTGTIPLDVFWPVAVMVAVAVAASGLFAGRLAERQERLAWQEIAAGRSLAGTDEPEEVAAGVAERARRLARAERAWVWWYREWADQLPIAAQVGPVSEETPVPSPVTPALLETIGRGPVPLAELDRRWVDLSGEMLALRLDPTGAAVALLAVAWDRPPRDRAILRERLRVFSPWAAEAIARAQSYAAIRESSRREHVLRQAAAKFAATLDRQVVLQEVIEAARVGLDASAALVERPSGRIWAGDAEVAEVLTGLAVETEAVGVETAPSPTGVLRTGRPRVASIEEGLALVSWRADPPLEEWDASWLEELAAVARASTERCAVYDRLQREEQLLRTNLEETPAPIAVWDAAGETVLTNAIYRSLDFRATPPSDVPAAGTREDEITVGDPPRTFVVLWTKTAEGRYVLSLYREITREREALRAKDELISMIGHELRSPLTSIQGYSQMMSRQLRVVQKQVDDLNRMIGDFVEASKMEGSRLPLRREKVDMVEVARAAVERFRGTLPARTVYLELAEVPFVEGDRARLGQVVDNLLGNAAKYSPSDREIVLTLGVSEGRVLLSVRDQGIGIAPEHLPHLFDRFYRVPTADTRGVKGLGLGLSIVRDIVAAHGGYVWAESAGPGKGSTFRVSLPAMEAEESGVPSSQVA